jgi:chromosomal replication initiator protein
MSRKKVPEIAFRVIEAVAAVYHCKKKEVLGPSRLPFFVRPRQIIMYLLHKRVELSQPVTGHLLGGRDHTTVLYGARKVERRMRADDDYRDRIDAFILMLGLERPPDGSAAVPAIGG